MTKEQHIKTQSEIVRVAEIVSTLDLGEFIRAINLSETVAPMIDPTLYMAAQGNLSALKKMAETLRQLQENYEEAIEAFTKTAMVQAGHFRHENREL